MWFTCEDVVVGCPSPYIELRETILAVKLRQALVCYGIKSCVGNSPRPQKDEDNRFVWLRVSGTAKMPQVDKCVRHQLHAVVPLLDELESQQQSLEFILPGKGPLHAKS